MGFAALTDTAIVLATLLAAAAEEAAREVIDTGALAGAAVDLDPQPASTMPSEAVPTSSAAHLVLERGPVACFGR